MGLPYLNVSFLSSNPLHVLLWFGQSMAMLLYKTVLLS